MIRCTLMEHPAVKHGFIVDVEDVIAGQEHPRLIVAREFKLGDRNDNFARAIDFARAETEKAIDARQPSVCHRQHLCRCGMAAVSPHNVGEGGCERFITPAPNAAPSDPRLGVMWEVNGNLCTDYTLRQQRGYHQEECGCWTRSPGSVNSLEDET